MSRLLATIAALVCGTMAQAWISVSLVPVCEGGAYCYDLVVTVTDDGGDPDDWVACSMTATLTGGATFVNNETYNPPASGYGIGDPYDSYFTSPALYPNDPNGVGAVTLVPGTVIEEPELRFGEWYDTVDTGAGTFVLHRLKMQPNPGGMYLIEGAVYAANTGGEVLPFCFTPPMAPFCPADLDNDWDVGLSDLALLLSNYGMPSGAMPWDGDLDGDWDVDLQDLADLLSQYGSCCD